MRIYIAAKSQLHAKELRDKLIAAGHIVTSTWMDDPFYGERPYIEHRRITGAKLCIAEVKASDALVLITGEGKAGGRHVEFGIAMALDLKIDILGNKENIFHWLPTIGKFSNADAYIASLSKEKS